jgi:hypothetical protein
MASQRELWCWLQASRDQLIHKFRDRLGPRRHYVHVREWARADPLGSVALDSVPCECDPWKIVCAAQVELGHSFDVGRELKPFEEIAYRFWVHKSLCRPEDLRHIQVRSVRMLSEPVFGDESVARHRTLFSRPGVQLPRDPVFIGPRPPCPKVMLTLPHVFVTWIVHGECQNVLVPYRLAGPRDSKLWRHDKRESIETPFICEALGLRT